MDVEKTDPRTFRIRSLIRGARDSDLYLQVAWRDGADRLVLQPGDEIVEQGFEVDNLVESIVIGEDTFVVSKARIRSQKFLGRNGFIGRNSTSDLSFNREDVGASTHRWAFHHVKNYTLIRTSLPATVKGEEEAPDPPLYLTAPAADGVVEARELQIPIPAGQLWEFEEV